MQISLMKDVDNYAGRLLCALLRAHDLITPERPVPEDIKSILVIKFWGMGSMILAGPVFKTLRKSYPDAKIHLATMASNKAVSELLRLADETLCLDVSGSTAAVPFKITRFLTRLRKIRPDAVVDLEYLTRFSALVSYISGAPIRVGFHSWDVWRGNLHNRRVAFSPYWHVTDNFLNLAIHLSGKDEIEKKLDLPVTDGAKREAQQAIEQAGIGQDEKILLINPNASTMALERRWPEEYFIDLIERINDRRLGRPVLIGAPDEADFVRNLHNRTASPEKTVNMAGALSLLGLTGMISRASLLITNDSGPLHLAGIIGTPTVSFFGPETPLLYGPVGKNHTVLYKGIECSPCISIYNAKTVRCLKERPECLRAITVDEAFQAVKEKIAGTSG